MDAVDIKAMALSQLGATQFQVKPDLSVIYFDGNATEPTESDINDKIALINVQEARKASYLPLEEQFDLQYKDLLDNGTRWQDHIAQVKADNPKP